MSNLIRSVIFLVLISTYFSCQKQKKKLPVLSKFEVVEGDTVYQKIAPFEFITQDSTVFKSEKLKGKPHVAFFFFTSCPGICPVMTSQMKRLQDMTTDIKDKYQIVGFTVDPDRDNPAKLKQYANKYRVDLSNWIFLTGEEKELYDIGINSYYVAMQRDSTEPGGYLHSGRFILVDKNGLIRGYYDGTNANEVDKLKKDLYILLEE
jgi:protein SCO1/2